MAGVGCIVFLAVMLGVVSAVVAIVALSRTTTLRSELELLGMQVRSLRSELGLLARERAEFRAGLGQPREERAEQKPQGDEVAATFEEEAPRPAVHEEAAEQAPPAGPDDWQPVEAPPPPPPPPPTIPIYQPPPPSASTPFDWESVIGVKLFSWIAAVAAVLGVVFFLKYSVEHGWVSPAVRAAIGLLTGTALIVVCEMRFAHGYRTTANAMHGAGIAILYATLFAMHALWHLAPVPVVFLLMLVVTAVAVALSIRRDSVFIALLGMLGGFATPALLSTGENRPIALFSYLLLLNAGLAWVAYRKRWPALTFGSLIFTVLYQWAWIAKFLTASQLPLAAGIFVVFALMGSSALWLRRDESDGTDAFERAGLASALLPLSFALFTAAVPAYGIRYNTLFAYLLLLSGGLALIAWKRGIEWLNTVAAAAVVLTIAIWFAMSYGKASPWPVVLGWMAVFVVLFLVCGRRPGSYAVHTAGLLFFAFPILAAAEPETASPALLFATMFALLTAIAFVTIRGDRELTWLLAAGFTILTEGVWSLKYLDSGRLGSALVIYAAFGLLFLVVPALARRSAAPAYLGLVAYYFLMGVASRSVLSIPPWPMLAALAALTLGAGIAALALRAPGLLTGGIIGAQLVLTIWAGNAPVAPWPDVALTATLAVAAFACAWAAFTHGRFPDQVWQGGATAALVALFGGHLVAMVAAASARPPLFASLLATQFVLVAAILLLVTITERWSVTVLSVVAAAIATACARPVSAQRELVFAALPYALFIAWPAVLGARARRVVEPWLGAVVASVVFFLFAREALYSMGYDGIIGVLPVGQAMVLLALLLLLLRMEPPGERMLGRLALVAGAALAFVTVAIPLQLEKQWITIGWALEAAALVWLFTRIPHRGLLAWSAALLAVVFVRLAFNPAVFSYHAAEPRPIVNWYLYTYGVPAAAFFVAAWRLPAVETLFRQAANTCGTILLFFLLNIEIADFYSTGRSLTFNFFSSSLAQDLTYTIGWALFAVAMLLAGLVLKVRAARVGAIVLLLVTVLKCFLHDLNRLGGLYRIGSLLGLAVSLVFVGVLLQRFVLRKAVDGEGAG